MTKEKIKKLTPEQTALLPKYLKEGLEIGLRCGLIDKKRAAAAVVKSYKCVNLDPPERILFVDSPQGAKDFLMGKIVAHTIDGDEYTLPSEDRQTTMPSFCYGQHEIYILQFYKFFRDECGIDLPMIEGLLETTNECGWFVPFDDLAVICERPTEVNFDEERRLHNDGKPGILFPDGFSVWATHGIRITNDKYKVHSSEWDSKWLMEETNVDMRRAMIELLTYERIIEDLDAKSIDTWREYELLQVTEDADVEPMNILKMTCPSTQMIHAIRVPPEMTKARDAAKWMNWDTDPEEFATEA